LSVSPALADVGRASTDRYGDPLPAGAIARLGTLRFRSGFLTYKAAFLPGGKTVASCSAGGGVALWDIATGKETHHFLDTHHTYAFACWPDGKLLACPNRKIHLFDAVTGREIRVLGGNEGGATMSVAFSADGKFLASGGHDNLARLWDVATGKEIRKFEGHQKTVYALAFFPDGNTLASYGLDNTIRLWDVPTGKQQAALTRKGDQMKSATFSWEHKLAASSNEDGTIVLWDLANQRVVEVIKIGAKPADAMGFSPDGKMLASGNGDGTIALW